MIMFCTATFSTFQLTLGGNASVWAGVVAQSIPSLISGHEGLDYQNRAHFLGKSFSIVDVIGLILCSLILRNVILSNLILVLVTIIILLVHLTSDAGS